MIFPSIGKMLIGAGILLVVVGLIVTIAGPFGLGRLPGDIVYQRGRTAVFIPIVTCLVISVALSIVMSLLSRWRR